MQQRRGKHQIERTDAIAYPVASMALCLALIYLSPFVSLALNYAAFAICVYRVVRYGSSVFAIDYCVLAGVSYIFLTTSMVSLLAWLSIVFILWHVVRKGIRESIPLALLLFLLAYMIVRVGTAFNDFVLCASQIVLLYILLSTQDHRGIVPSALAFCGNLILSSVYALVFRDAYQIRALLGDEVAAYFGSTLTRFQGLFRDSNYYMALLLIAIALLVILFVNRRISLRVFVAGMGALIVCGALTYSKTFIVVLAVLAVIFVVGLFRKGYTFAGLCSVFVGGIVVVLLSDTLFSVTLYRIVSAQDVYDLTTGRSKLVVDYLAEITQSAGVLLFGSGLSADILRRGTHNLFLEVVYCFGAVGLIAMLAYFATLGGLFSRAFDHKAHARGGMLKYAALVAFVLLFCTLQGLTFTITYIMLYLAILAMEITPNDALPQRQPVVQRGGNE